MELPKYHSHKTVEAAPIAAYRAATMDKGGVLTEVWIVTVIIDGVRHEVAVPHDTFFGRAMLPQIGDYLVKYVDKDQHFWSVSAKDVFGLVFAPAPAIAKEADSA